MNALTHLAAAATLCGAMLLSMATANAQPPEPSAGFQVEQRVDARFLPNEQRKVVPGKDTNGEEAVMMVLAAGGLVILAVGVAKAMGQLHSDAYNEITTPVQ